MNLYHLSMKSGPQEKESNVPAKPKKTSTIVKTVCHRDCPDTCFVDVVVEDGRIISTRGCEESPITRGFLCPRGVGDPKRVYSKERILYPHVKNGSEFRRISWSELSDWRPTD